MPYLRYHFKLLESNFLNKIDQNIQNQYNCVVCE